MDRESKITQGHNDSQNTQNITNVQHFQEDILKSALTVCFALFQVKHKTAINYPTQLKPPCIEILFTFKL